MTRAPDLIHPVAGYRVFGLDERGCLHSWGMPYEWERGENRATCHRRHPPGNLPPAAGCGCGLYALHRHSDRRLRKQGQVIGAIAASGAIEVHKAGFRAERAEVIALARRDRTSKAGLRRLELAAERYGVPLVPIRRLRCEVERRALPVPPALLPSPPAPVRPARPARRRRSPGEPLLLPRDGEVGYWLRGHLRCECTKGEVTVSLTEGFAALLGCDTRAVFCAPGAHVAQGEAIGVIRSGGRELVVFSPFDGELVSVNERLAGGIQFSRIERVPEGERERWVARIRAKQVPADASPLVWGEGAHASYRAHVNGLADDEALAAELALDRHLVWSRVRSIGELRAVLSRGSHRTQRRHLSDPAAIRRLAALLDRWIVDDERLGPALTELGVAIRFRVEDCDAELALRPSGEPGGWASADVGDREPAAVVIGTSGEALHRYWSGELDVGRAVYDEVELIDGTRGELLLATSLLQRLFPRYREHAVREEEPHQRARRAVARPK